MAPNIAEICLFYLNSPYLYINIIYTHIYKNIYGISKYFKSMLAFFSLQFAEQCQVEIKMRTKIKDHAEQKASFIKSENSVLLKLVLCHF